jgi:GNAT superfamily N-acetyltransferase
MDIRNVDLDTVWQMRHEVMYPNEAFSYVQLPDDETGRHLGLYIENKPVSVVSLFDQGTAVQFRKFATLDSEQGKGYGSRLLDHIIKRAQIEGKERIWCNARVAAAGFYERFGMYTTGDGWWTKDIEFIKMEKQLN